MRIIQGGVGEFDPELDFPTQGRFLRSASASPASSTTPWSDGGTAGKCLLSSHVVYKKLSLQLIAGHTAAYSLAERLKST